MITSDPFILHYVSNCELEFNYFPTPNCIPSSLYPESIFFNASNIVNRKQETLFLRYSLDQKRSLGFIGLFPN